MPRRSTRTRSSPSPTSAYPSTSSTRRRRPLPPPPRPTPPVATRPPGAAPPSRPPPDAPALTPARLPPRGPSQAYEPAEGARLGKEDNDLLVASSLVKAKEAGAAGGQPAVSGAVRNKQLREGVTWLRKTPLMGNNLYETSGFGKKGAQEPIERQHVANEVRTLALGRSAGPRSLQEQVDVIDQTFTQAADITVADVRHPTNPALRATAVLPVLPDFRCWSNQYVQMQFDLDPAFAVATDQQPLFDRARVSNALIKGFSTPATDNTPAQSFVAYLLPPADGEGEGEGAAAAAAAAAAGGGADGEVELEWVREYSYDLKKGMEAQRGETCFLVIDDDKVTYNEFETKIALSRKSIPAQARPSKVTLREREVTEAEEEERAKKRQALQLAPQLLLTDQTAAAFVKEAAEEAAAEEAAGAGGDAAAAADDAAADASGAFDPSAD